MRLKLLPYNSFWPGIVFGQIQSERNIHGDRNFINNVIICFSFLNYYVVYSTTVCILLRSVIFTHAHMHARTHTRQTATIMFLP